MTGPRESYPFTVDVQREDKYITVGTKELLIDIDYDGQYLGFGLEVTDQELILVRQSTSTLRSSMSLREIPLATK